MIPEGVSLSKKMNSPPGRHCPPIKPLSLTVPLPAFLVLGFNLLRTIHYVNIEHIHSGAESCIDSSLLTALNVRTHFFES